MNAEEILKKIDSLPSGGLTIKTIRGKAYTYYQWTENGKQRSRIVKEEEYDNLKKQIEERKKLQTQVSNLEIYKNKDAVTSQKEVFDFITDVRIGKTLEDFSATIKDYKKRELYSAIEQYVYGDTHDKVFILYGLRRTGKTTLIRQVIYNMKNEDKNKSVFIQINPTNTLAEVNKDLRKLETLGYKYVFIDEVTMMDDFIQGAALFSDVFASSGMKIVLSGTDSLGFVFSEDEQLYDRCFLLHTTFIPFREFSNVLDIHDVDQYMEFGGTMSQSGDNYNKAIFGTKKSTAEYVNTAIARNIQHSLKNYQYGSHFRNLKALYDKGELTNAINRIVEDMNHDFTIEVLTRTFKSHDFGSAKDIMRKDRENPTDILDDVDGEKITEKLKKLLRILNQEEQKIEIQDAHRLEIKEYLDLLDLTCDIPLVNMNDLSSKKVTTVFSQPGLRYSQAESLIKSLMMDETFRNIDAQERKRITERILDDIKGRMLEEIVQLETKKANPNLEIFKLQFAVGEFDMVVYDPENVCCKIYEVKHSKEKSSFQYRHLINEENCKQTEFRFGKILEKVVLYRGETCEEENGIHYKNVEEYLIEN